MTADGEGDDEEVFRDIDALESQVGGLPSETLVSSRYFNVVK